MSRPATATHLIDLGKVIKLLQVQHPHKLNYADQRPHHGDR
jgi:hypothetical protein